ncbi:hypothetical protein JIN84_13015 [Luteolibacter yonseiensis]|uniref:Uncharacterized protein n=1 Tax=Luteolibacter yonseiensis TaxID=1144680 RepID=A0A934R6X3_9BACT|nr:hypothetical protein [Luteolibacter yonseiensis]MBK1816540.1 hypothetical protein [Luteolibacter yonseiensis]
MIPGTYNMDSFLRGDWWDGVPSIRITVNGEPPLSPIVSARLQFRTGNLLGCQIETPTGIVIEDAAGWHLSIPAQALALQAGAWNYDLETTDAEDVVRTYIKGTITVIQDITR